MDAVPVGVPLGGPYEVVVVGASTGGPGVIEAMLKALPRRFPAPLVVCQHMPVGFTAHWAQRLDSLCRVAVREARDRDPLAPGTVLIAPIGTHALLERGANGGRIRLTPDFADRLHVPSVDILMGSAAREYGSMTLAALLSGIGSDGASGMLAVRRAGGYTLAQDRATCVMYGMPGSAVESGAVAESVPDSRLADRIMELTRRG